MALSPDVIVTLLRCSGLFLSVFLFRQARLSMIYSENRFPLFGIML